MKDPVSEALSCAPPTALQRLTPAQMPELISLTSHPTPQHRRLRPRQYPSDMADREGGLKKECRSQPKLAVERSDEHLGGKGGSRRVVHGGARNIKHKT